MKKTLKERFFMFCLAVGIGLATAAFPAVALADLTTNGNASNGNAPAFNTAVQGESAGTLEGAAMNAMNWVGNIICPILAVGAGVSTVMQVRSGGKWMPHAATCGGLLSISAIMRLAEYWIVNTSSTGITN
jgi:hypothetical protein